MNDSVWFCEHCNREIKNKSTAWSRSRSHWCSEGCYWQDNMSVQDIEDRKRRARELKASKSALANALSMRTSGTKGK